MTTRVLTLALKTDAAATGAMGLLLLGGARFLAGPLGIGAGTLALLGGLLIAVAGFVLWAGTRAQPLPAAVWAIVAINLLWVLASVTAVLAGWFPLTALGTAFVLAQAVVVVAFAQWQFSGLRKR